MTYRRTGSLKDIVKGLKKIVERNTYEVPTGPHTDVRKRKINPSFMNPDVESGALKEFKRKKKIKGMGLKNVVKRMVGLKGGGKAKK